MFELLKKCPETGARRGRLATAHGVVETPVFMPVGTRAAVKTMEGADLEALGASIILGNTYHLSLRPGRETMRAAGGLHQFMNWTRPILTDSGGFQVFSLAKIRKIEEHGVAFHSHIDGAPLFLGPVEAMGIQCDLASDIAMVFDDCPPHTATEGDVAAAVERTLRWARTCREQPRAEGQLVFGIGQGGMFDGLRRQCAEELVKMDFDGYAVGGLSVGEPEEAMLRAVEVSEPLLPEAKPRYAMGLGTPPQLLELVARGIDMFDCVLPTRAARHGTAYTRHGTLNLKAAAYREDFGPLEEGCSCSTCVRYSRAYVRHLLNVGEFLGQRLLTLHNLNLYLGLMAEVREALEAGTFARFRASFVRDYSSGMTEV